MATVNIIIPDDLKAKAEAQVALTGHGSLNEYVEEVIREDVERKLDSALEAELLKGLASPMSEMMPKDWGDSRK